MRMKRMPTCPNVLASVISDVTSRLQKMGDQWFPQAKKPGQTSATPKNMSGSDVEAKQTGRSAAWHT